MTLAEAEAIVINHAIHSPEWDAAIQALHCAMEDIEAQRTVRQAVTDGGVSYPADPRLSVGG